MAPTSSLIQYIKIEIERSWTIYLVVFSAWNIWAGLSRHQFYLLHVDHIAAAEYSSADVMPFEIELVELVLWYCHLEVHFRKSLQQIFYEK